MSIVNKPSRSDSTYPFRAIDWLKQTRLYIRAYWQITFFAFDESNNILAAYLDGRFTPIKESVLQDQKESLSAQEATEELSHSDDSYDYDDSLDYIEEPDNTERTVYDLEWPDEHAAWITEKHVRSGLSAAKDVYESQNIVLITSLLESVIKDYCNMLFAFKPERMIPYLRDKIDESDLKRILISESIPDIHAALRAKVIESIFGGGAGKTVERLSKIDPESQLDKALKNRLLNVIKMRNEIVHGTGIVSLTHEVVPMGFNSVLYLIRHLYDVSLKNNYPLDSTNWPYATQDMFKE